MTTRGDASRFETGNVNLPDIQALNAAIDLIEKVGVENVEKHVQALGDRLIDHLDQLGIPLVGPRARNCRAHIYVLGLPAAEWAEYFAQNQVRVSPERDGIRVSFGMFNTIEDVDRLAQLIRRRGSEAASSRAVERMD
jgi:selenocysteine lyase/cysteine desulfurase